MSISKWRLLKKNLHVAFWLTIAILMQANNNNRWSICFTITILIVQMYDVRPKSERRQAWTERKKNCKAWSKVLTCKHTTNN